MSPTRSSLTALPGTIEAATTANAADEKSPGSDTAPGSRRSAWRTVIRRAEPPLTIGTVRTGADSTSAPAAASRRSVWSRVEAGSVTWVSPSASRPAMSTHDLTWALATGIR